MNTFPKSEKLCGRNAVNTLYRDGHKFITWPLRVTWLKTERQDTNQVLVWAPKALFKRAVRRNLLKRRMREAYRLNKQPVADRGYRLAFNYIDKDIQPYAVIEKAMIKALRKLAEA